MNRPIRDFHRDEEGDWVADLSCGHGQHTRHDPPFTLRDWVETEEGRAGRIGSELDCLLCDRSEMPIGHAPYQRTKTFDADTVPKALLANHTTKRGVWAKIHVESGELEYTIHDPRFCGGAEEICLLDANRVGIVISEIEHRVKPMGDVSFHVEFWRAS